MDAANDMMSVFLNPWCPGPNDGVVYPKHSISLLAKVGGTEKIEAETYTSNAVMLLQLVDLVISPCWPLLFKIYLSKAGFFISLINKHTSPS